MSRGRMDAPLADQMRQLHESMLKRDKRRQRDIEIKQVSQSQGVGDCPAPVSAIGCLCLWGVRSVPKGLFSPDNNSCSLDDMHV
jgi:hypothetical protein